MDYLGRSNIIMKILRRDRQKGQGRRSERKRFNDAILLL